MNNKSMTPERIKKSRFLLLSSRYTSTRFVKTKSLLKTRKHWNELSHQLLIQNKPEDQILKYLTEADDHCSCILQQGYLLYVVSVFASHMPAFHPNK